MLIDTETHVFQRLFPLEINPEVSIARRYTWHAYSGDLLVAEMDRAGVDKAILISYDADDIHPWLSSIGRTAEDFIGGKKYALKFFRKFPDRFIWFTTLKDPVRHPTEYLELAQKDLGDGALGIKVFPAYYRIPADDPHLLQAYETCRARNAKVILSLEGSHPPHTPSLPSYYLQIAEVLRAFPDANFQIMHGGNVDPRSTDAQSFFAIARSHRNLWISTSPLEANGPGDTGLEWCDGVEYPFPHYLSGLEALMHGVGVEKIMWGTDWPWMEYYFNYPQAVEAIRKHASFMSEKDKSAFLGLNAARFLELPS